jgi:hypothetical protein
MCRRSQLWERAYSARFCADLRRPAGRRFLVTLDGEWRRKNFWNFRVS